MEAIKAYTPASSSVSSGQVLACPYTADKALIVIMEMADNLALELVDKRLVTDQIVLAAGYDVENLSNPAVAADCRNELHTDHYGRQLPKPAHGSISLDSFTSSAKEITEATVKLFRRIVNPHLLVRRLNITANHIISENRRTSRPVQLDLFHDYEEQNRQEQQRHDALVKERRMQETVISLKKQFGKNSILKGLNFQDGATGKERNRQIGGHKA